MDQVSTPGDVYWANQAGFIPMMIRVAQRKKYGAHNNAALYNHCFMVVGYNGEIVQANAGGIERGNLSNYGPADKLTARRPPYAPLEDVNATAAMRELLLAHTSYGWLTIASCGLSLLTGTKLRFGIDGTEICSGSVAWALTRANIDCGEDENFDTPADLFHIATTQGWATC